jgi:RNA polymerase sigma factor (sigma-70 family)
MSAPFPTTRRSVIEALGSDDAEQRERAFGTLVSIYWRPLYKYARVTHRLDSADAEDATQGFLAAALEKGSLAPYDPAKAGFRTFLRLLFDRFLLNEAKSGQRLKRGGGAAHIDFGDAEAEIGRELARSGTPEDYFQREWVRSVFAFAVERLRAASEESGRQNDFALFEAYDLDESSRLSYRQLGEIFGISEATVTNRLAAMRKRFRELVLDVLREVTASERELRSEVRSLLGVDL